MNTLFPNQDGGRPFNTSCLVYIEHCLPGNAEVCRHWLERTWRTGDVAQPEAVGHQLHFALAVPGLPFCIRCPLILQ